jgi:dipeptidyl aminopeptidase/acylaminoacyl peptidase
MGASLWQRPDKYMENSPLYFADRIKTPLLLACGTQDDISLDQTRGMYASLRRLGERAEYREYLGGAHAVDSWNRNQQIDFLDAMLKWFETYLVRDGVAPQ